MKLKTIVAVLAFLSSGLVAHASPETDELSQKLIKTMPGLTIDSIAPSVIPGLYEEVSGVDVAYVTADGVHMIQGTLFNVPERKNLSENTLSRQRAKAIQALPASSLIVYKAKGKEQHVITVFTDPSCPYCHRLHDEIPKLNDLGVTVRYALYARGGEGTLTSRQLSEVICSPDPKAAIDVRDLQVRLYQFADDSMMGRQVGRVGNKKGTDYIAAEVKRLGLLPGGPNGSYFQVLPYHVRKYTEHSQVAAQALQASMHAA